MQVSRCVGCINKLSRKNNPEPGIERGVEALADISRSTLCCHGNENRAPIANPPHPTNAQLDGTPTIPLTYIRVRAVVWECGEGETDRHRHKTAMTNIYRPILPRLRLTAIVMNWNCQRFVQQKADSCRWYKDEDESSMITRSD